MTGRAAGWRGLSEPMSRLTSERLRDCATKSNCATNTKSIRNVIPIPKLQRFARNMNKKPGASPSTQLQRRSGGEGSLLPSLPSIRRARAKRERKLHAVVTSERAQCSVMMKAICVVERTALLLKGERIKVAPHLRRTRRHSLSLRIYYRGV